MCNELINKKLKKIKKNALAAKYLRRIPSYFYGDTKGGILTEWTLHR